MKLHTFKHHIKQLEKDAPLDTEIIQFMQWYKYNWSKFRPRSLDEGLSNLMMLGAPYPVRDGFTKVWEMYEKAKNKIEEVEG